MTNLFAKVEEKHALDMKYLAEKIVRWNETKDGYAEAITKIEELNSDSIEVSGGWALHVRASGNGALLTEIIRALRTSGWKSEDPRPEANTDYWSADFYKEDTKGSIALSFSSTVCRRVKVGTRMVEQDVYETQCGDDEVAQ